MTYPEGFSAADWRRWVRHGKALVRTKTNAQFDLGDLTLKMVKRRPRDGQNHGVRNVLAAFAGQIGLSESTLTNYRYIALAWPKERRNPRESFAVHAALAAHPSRYRKINDPPIDPVSGERRWTVNEALRAAGRAPNHPVTPQERVDKVRDLVAEDADAVAVMQEILVRPAVVRKVMEHPSSRYILRRAQQSRPDDIGAENLPGQILMGEGDAASYFEPGDEARRAAPKHYYSEAPREVLEFLGICTTFYTQMQRMIPSLHVADYDPDTKRTLLSTIDRVRAAAGWAETVINTGDTSMDAALEKLLKDES